MGHQRGLLVRDVLNDSLGVQLKQRHQPPGMVEVTVGKDHEIDVEQIDVRHPPRVPDEHVRVSDVEQDGRVPILDEIGRPGFAVEVVIDQRVVVHEHGQFHVPPS